jgi:hypothetical protein
MESLRVKLIAAGATLAVTALLVFAVMSIKPGDNRKLARINVADLAPGRVIELNTEAMRYFAIRPLQGEIYVIAAPIVDNTVPMPEKFWWKPHQKCKDFGLETKNGVVDLDSRFRCRDADQPEEWAKRWQWDAHGRHVPDETNTPIDDLYRLTFKHSGNEIIPTSIAPD